LAISGSIKKEDINSFVLKISLFFCSLIFAKSMFKV
jgi:hypothetical protein